MMLLAPLLPALLVISVSGNHLPVSPIFQGHKSRLPLRYTMERSYSNGECDQLIVKWSSWSGSSGLDGKVRIKAKGDPAISGWTVTLNFDRDVKSCHVYDAIVSNSSSRNFVASAKSWNRDVAEDAEKVLDVQVTWDSGTQEPKLARINIDGQGYQCITGGGPTTPPSPSTPHDGSTSAPVQTTTQGVSTTTAPSPPKKRGIFAQWPKKVVGLYVLLADDDHENFTSTDVWEPELYEYQQEGANVLFFTFIHPTTMAVPPAFQKLAATRGTDKKGAVPKDTVVIFAIGGYAYSIQINPWHWLTSKEAAETMAAEVAEWPRLYGCDGIDLDIEDGAGDAPGAGENLIHFVRKLRELSPNMIISQPTYGYPAIDAEIDLINASWDSKGKSSNLADSIGLMVYEGTSSLNFVANYMDGPGRWEGFPMTCRAPSNTIILGAKGQAGDATISKLVDRVIEKNYLGIMVWYVSVPNGLQYGVTWDGSDPAHQQSFVNAMQKLKKHQHTN